VQSKSAIIHRENLFTQLCEQVREAMERLNVPGVAIGVIDGEEEHIASFGVTSIDHPLPVTNDTLFQIGSTTKTVTATTVMRLVEAGKLDLDLPVRTYLPRLTLSDPDVAGRVTLRHLLSHTGGWVGDLFIDTGTGRDAVRRAVARMRNLPQLTPLDTVWHYNNAGFYIAGRVIEAVTRKSYEQAAREWVLNPLNMKMSFFTADEAITYRVAIGHNNIPDETGNRPPTVARPWGLPRSAAPVGTIISTVPDQLRYARFHMGDGRASGGERLLSEESMRLMQTPRIEASNGEQFGIGWFISDLDGTKLLRHGGATNGQMSAFALVPSRQWAITILTNAGMGRTLHTEIVAWALKHYIGYTPPPDDPIESTAEDLAPYVGHYSGLVVDLDLYLQDGALAIQSVLKQALPGQEMPPQEPPVTLARYAPDKLVMLDGPSPGTHIEFIRDPETNNITWLRYGGRIYAREP
jgi:CubicO group peptidase (beta-lactamase class C family)